MMFSLRVPATTANIGPGFDTFGMALNFYNYMTIGEAESLCLDIQGEGSGSLAGGKNNLFVRAAQMVYDEVGAGNVAMSVSMINNIPLARGMGSSAATIIGGMVAANHILNNPLPQEEILQLATALEGHPDNVAPALLGGFVCVCQDGGKLHTLNFPPPQALKAIVVVPQVRLSTEKARSAMPKNVSLKDAVFNVSHAAFLALALQKGDIDTFGFMLQDRLHQQYRFPLIKGAHQVIDAAVEAGAMNCVISGSGSTMIAFAKDNEQIIGQAMEDAFKALDIDACYHCLEADNEGAKILPDNIAMEG